MARRSQEAKINLGKPSPKPRALVVTARGGGKTDKAVADAEADGKPFILAVSTPKALEFRETARRQLTADVIGAFEGLAVAPPGKDRDRLLSQFPGLAVRVADALRSGLIVRGQ